MFWPNMFGLNLAFGKFSNFVRTPYQASKKCVRISQKNIILPILPCAIYEKKKSLSTYFCQHQLPFRPFLRIATIALTAINIS